METGGGRATSERTADIKVVAITVGARADNGVCEGDRVRFRPSNLLAEAGGVLRLIGSAGECRLGAHPHVRSLSDGEHPLLRRADCLVGIERGRLRKLHY